MTYKQQTQSAKSSNPFDAKYMREYPFMAFGSLMNGVAQMHQQKPLELGDYICWAREMFKLAKELTREGYEFGNDIKETDPEQTFVQVKEDDFEIETITK